MFDFSKIVDITAGKIISDNYSGFIKQFITDSRSVVNPQAGIFVAIKGIQHDGHHYIESLYEKGVRQFIIEQGNTFDQDLLDHSNIVLVRNSIEALQKIASFHRSQFRIPIIGITGSNGKTIVKEWIGQLLAEHYRIAKSPKSYNSQLGVPLSVLQLTEWNNLGIFEAGISKNGEMDRLQKVISPTIGIFTNIGSAHDEGFKDHDEKAIEKWKLFRNCDAVIYCEDHELVKKNKPKDLQTFGWGRSDRAKLRIVELKKSNTQSQVHLHYNDYDVFLKIPFTDDVSLENVMHCIALMIYLKIPSEEIDAALQRLTNIDRRLSLKRGINNCYLVDDSYNNDLAGLQIALDFLKNQPNPKRKVILSDILQSGLDEEALFTRINEILHTNGIEDLIGIGPGMFKNKNAFRMKADFYRSTDHFLKDVNLDDFHDESILVKGARAFEFEKITNFLSEKIHGTVLEINMEALNNNLNYYRSKLDDGVKIMVMVKASAYGSGSHEIANLMQHNRVDYLAVAYPDEGLELRKRGIYLPIMVMNVSPESFVNISKFELEPEIYSINQLRSLISFSRNEGTKHKIHLKFDSGMHRLGFEDSDISALIDLLRSAPQLEIATIYSHLAGADEEIHNQFTRKQVAVFQKQVLQLERALRIKPIKHILNSAGIIRFPEYQMDMVRLGIGLYGFEATQQNQDYLQPISTLKTVISQIRNVKKGETIGYGRKGIVDRDSKIATIAIGYADGFSRAFSNGRIKLLVNDKLAPVIGNVCMDMTMLDITGIEAREGDDVIIFGQKPTIKELADAIGTIPYEILTSISSRVTRVFYSA